MNASEALVAAYRDGLGLAAVTLIAGNGGVRLVSFVEGEEPALAAGEIVQARWWCRSAQHAEWLVEAAAPRGAREIAPDDAGRMRDAIVNAAKLLGIALRADEEIAAEAVAVIARLEQEIAAQQLSGALKSVNRGYRDYRLQASARGEKVLRYGEWMDRYKAKLLRDIAQNLRQF